MITNLVIVVFTSLSFIIYGINSFTSNRMVNEYQRWGFGKYRKIIGLSQILCGGGLLIGIKLRYPIILPRKLSPTSSASLYKKDFPYL